MSTDFVTTIRGRRPAKRSLGAVVAAVALIASGCATPGVTSPPSATSPAPSHSPAASTEPTSSPALSPSGTITLYTSNSQSTVDAVVEGYRTSHPGVTVDVFRAPTGEIAGRVATELRAGRIRGDILWLTDPLSIQAYAAQGLLRTWQPVEASGIDSAFRGDTFWGTRFLNMVIVRNTTVTPGPAAWHDLTDPAYKDAVAIPDPGFAGSAFGALGYFAQTDGFGLEFYKALKANGATQVKSPDEVTTGVAEGRFKVGMTLDNSARRAIAKGSPIQLVWPSDGAIAMYGPIGVVGATENAPAAESFVEFVLSDPGQRAIADTGWQPIRAGLGGPQPEGPQVYPNWAAVFGRQKELLTEYRALFGG